MKILSTLNFSFLVFIFSGLKTAGLVCGGLLCGAGGFTYVYARRNPDFRSNVEKYIPGSKTVFFYTIGSTENSFTDPFEKPLPKFEPNTKLPSMYVCIYYDVKFTN